MKIVEAEARIRSPNTQEEWKDEVNNIASAARISRGAEDSDRPPEELVGRLIRKGHLNVLEFGSMTVAFTLDRAIANELTRHRHISCVQESTRYVPYLYDIPVIKPSGISPNTMMYDLWEDAALVCEHAYQEAIRYGLDPEYARSMSPHSLATHLIVKPILGSGHISSIYERTKPPTPICGRSCPSRRRDALTSVRRCLRE